MDIEEANGSNDTVVDDTEIKDEQQIEPTEEAAQETDESSEDQPLLEIDGEKLTAAQIQEALQVYRNQAEFTTKNQQEAERLNVMAKVIEETRLGLIGQNANTPTVSHENTSAFSAEQFQEALLGDNPGEAMTQLANFIQQTVAKQTSEVEARNTFMKTHPDYNETINSPGYKAFIANSPLGPYLNDVTGYYEYKATVIGDAVKDAETNGFKEGEKKALSNARAKTNIKLLNSSGGVSQPARAQITPDTPHVDVLNAATQFLASKRQNQ